MYNHSGYTLPDELTPEQVKDLEMVTGEIEEVNEDEVEAAYMQWYLGKVAL